jgi:hypothetical protein
MIIPMIMRTAIITVMAVTTITIITTMISVRFGRVHGSFQ